MKTKIYNLPACTDTQRSEIARQFQHGAVAVVATDTVYGLAALPSCEAALNRICTLKNRPLTQPFQLLLPNVESACQLAQFPAPAARLARAYWPGALTLILPPAPLGKPFLRGAKGLGLRVPDFAPLSRLLAALNAPLACTSANLHGQTPITQEEGLAETFDGKVELMLLAGPLSPTASCVVDFTQHPPRLLREGKITTIELTRTSGILL